MPTLHKIASGLFVGVELILVCTYHECFFRRDDFARCHDMELFE